MLFLVLGSLSAFREQGQQWITLRPGMNRHIAIDGMRVDPATRLDHQELSESAENYRRPAVRWLLRWAEKNQLTGL